MRSDKLTTKFQMALADAQSLAVGRDPPVHRARPRDDGVARPTGRQRAPPAHRGQRQRQRAPFPARRGPGRPAPRCRAPAATCRLSNELGRVMNVMDKLAQERKDQYISSELFVLAALDAKDRVAELLKANAAERAALETAIEKMRGGETVDDPECRRAAPGVGEIHHRPHRARRAGQAGPGHRQGRRNSPHHPGAAAAHQEQPGAHR